MMEKSVIKVNNLKKHFGKTKAVDGISFEVKKGEIFGFLGPNGAGKTTTIRCLMDFTRPTDGSISILGLDSVKDSVEIKKTLGYLPGNVRLYSKWTGEDHIKFIEGLRGKSPKAHELIERLGLDPKKKVKDLSSGNNQKLGLILALMHNPKVIIMDEPTVALDPLLQNTIYEILEELRKEGTTIFISSHNLPEVERICDRAGIIKEGKLVSIENIENLHEKRLRRIEVHFEDEYSAKEFDFNGVEKIERIKDGLIITVHGDINMLLKKITNHRLHDIEISHSTLEDIFMEFYRRK